MATVKIPGFGLNIGTGKFTVDAANGNTVSAGSVTGLSLISSSASEGEIYLIKTGGSANTSFLFNDGTTFGIRDQTNARNPFAITLATQAATFGGVAITVASATGTAGLRIPHGVAPTSPVNGDTWTTTAGAFIRINGVTKTFTLT